MNRTEFIDSLSLFVTDTLKDKDATETQLATAASIAHTLLQSEVL